jgi:hypothetical protein
VPHDALARFRCNRPAEAHEFIMPGDEEKEDEGDNGIDVKKEKKKMKQEK